MRSRRFPKQKWFCRITVQMITERWWILSYVMFMYFSIARANREKRREHFKTFREYSLNRGRVSRQIAFLDMQLPL